MVNEEDYEKFRDQFPHLTDLEWEVIKRFNMLDDERNRGVGHENCKCIIQSKRSNPYDRLMANSELLIAKHGTKNYISINFDGFKLIGDPN